MTPVDHQLRIIAAHHCDALGDALLDLLQGGNLPITDRNNIIDLLGDVIRLKRWLEP